MLLLVGKTTDTNFARSIDDYVQRTQHYIPFDVEVIPELKNTRKLTFEQQKEQEGQLILKAVGTGDTLVLLDEQGKEFRSIEFARWIEQKQATVSKRLIFAVGGPYGFSPAVYARANEKLSLSKMTFSHQMIRLIFAEQLYRALSILGGSPYHHE